MYSLLIYKKMMILEFELMRTLILNRVDYVSVWTKKMISEN